MYQNNIKLPSSYVIKEIKAKYSFSKRKSAVIALIKSLKDNFKEVTPFKKNLLTLWELSELISFTETLQINSYNWSGPIVYDLREFTIDNEKYIAISFHLFGDVRANYSYCIIFHCSYADIYNFFLDYPIQIVNTKKYDVYLSLLEEYSYVYWRFKDKAFYHRTYYEDNSFPKALHIKVNNWLWR